MKTIYKYQLTREPYIKVTIPMEASILCVQIDQKDNTPCIWAVVDTEAELEERFFEIIGTGNPIHTETAKMKGVLSFMGIERKYIGTFQEVPFVWHLFERIN
jgi:hypothetical protein